MNKIILTGRLGKDAEIKDFGETTSARFTLATNKFSKKNGKGTDWHNCSFYNPGKVAEFLTKGRLIALEGTLVYYDRQIGETTVKVASIEVHKVELLGSKDDAEPRRQDPEAQPADEDGDGIPF